MQRHDLTAPDHETTEGIPCVWMRGGTSKGAFFLADDLPTDPAARNELLLRIMGTPDPRQIDGIGGATSLTSKVAVVSRSQHPDADIDYLFLQVGVEQPTVSDQQNCGNIVAAVGQFALETGLVSAAGDSLTVRIHMVNSGRLVRTSFPVRDQLPDYQGGVHIDGVPGMGTPVVLSFEVTGSSTAELFPTGNLSDTIDGIALTCADNGMPVIVAHASSFGLTGYEPHAELAANAALLDRIDHIRVTAAGLMGLGDTRALTIPKTVLLSPGRDGGQLSARSFIPVQPHTSIGVFAAISAGTAVMTPGTVCHDLTADWPAGLRQIDIEHPSGRLLVNVELDTTATPVRVCSAGVIRTARKLFAGRAFPRPR